MARATMIKAEPYLDLSGGINQGPHPTQISASEMADLLNFYPWGGKLKKRPGRTQVVSSLTSVPSLIFALSNDDGWDLIIGHSQGLSRKDGMGVINLNIRDGSAYADSSNLWRARQYGGIGYAVRRNTGTVKRFKADFMEDAGIPAPLAAPTIAQGAAGALTAANYYGVFTYYNSETQMESHPSTASAVLALAASKKINWTGITASPTGQVNARRLYRTLPGQLGQYFFVGQIDNNTDTTFTGEEVITGNMGRRVSFRNGLPPTGVLFVEIWGDRAWLSDGRSVFFSEQFLPECYYSLSEIEISPDDGHVIRGLHAWGERLIIPKTNAMYYLTGSSSNDFDVKVLSDRHGCVAPDSIKSAEGLLIWFEGSNFYSAVGNSVSSISDTKIRDLIDAIPPEERQNVVSAMYPRLGQYRVSIPQAQSVSGHSSGFRKELVYNYRTGVWTVFDYPEQLFDATATPDLVYGVENRAPIVYGDVYDENYQQLVYAGFGGSVVGDSIFDVVSGTSDDGVAISGIIKPRRLGLDSAGRLQSLLGGLLLCDRSTGTTTIRLYRDGVLFNSRVISLDHVDEWKPFNLSNAGQLAATIDFELEHSGTDDFGIEAIVLNRSLIERSGQPQ